MSPLVARSDGPYRLRCGRVACGRRFPGIWVIPHDHDGEPVNVVVAEVVWRYSPVPGGWRAPVPGVLRDRLASLYRLASYARKDVDYLNGRRDWFRRPPRGPQDLEHRLVPDGLGQQRLVCPHCGAPQRVAVPKPAAGVCVPSRRSSSRRPPLLGTMPLLATAEQFAETMLPGTAVARRFYCAHAVWETLNDLARR